MLNISLLNSALVASCAVLILLSRMHKDGHDHCPWRSLLFPCIPCHCCGYAGALLLPANHPRPGGS